MTEFKYPKSRRVVMAQCPGAGGPLPIFGDVPSQSADRMTALYGDWRDQALGVNLWWYGDDQINKRDHHLEQIINETECEIVVALGGFVQQALGMDKRMVIPFGEESLVLFERPIVAVRFPHPSGRSRFWNWAPNRVEASNVLRRVLRDT